MSVLFAGSVFLLVQQLPHLVTEIFVIVAVTLPFLVREGRSHSWRKDWLSQPGSKTGDREQRTRLGYAEAVFKVK